MLETLQAFLSLLILATYKLTTAELAKFSFYKFFPKHLLRMFLCNYTFKCDYLIIYKLNYNNKYINRNNRN